MQANSRWINAGKGSLTRAYVHVRGQCILPKIANITVAGKYRSTKLGNKRKPARKWGCTTRYDKLQGPTYGGESRPGADPAYARLSSTFSSPLINYSYYPEQYRSNSLQQGPHFRSMENLLVQWLTTLTSWQFKTALGAVSISVITSRATS